MLSPTCATSFSQQYCTADGAKKNCVRIEETLERFGSTFENLAVPPRTGGCRRAEQGLLQETHDLYDKVRAECEPCQKATTGSERVFRRQDSQAAPLRHCVYLRAPGRNATRTIDRTNGNQSTHCKVFRPNLDAKHPLQIQQPKSFDSKMHVNAQGYAIAQRAYAST